MGDKLRTGQRTARRRRRERAVETMDRPNLLTQTEVVQAEYPVYPAPGERFAVGEVLDVYPGEQPDRVACVRGPRLAGHSHGEAAARLARAMAESGTEAVRVQVVRVSPFGVATVRIPRKDGGR